MRYFNLRLGYYFFRFRRTNSRHVGIFIPVWIVTYSSSSAWWIQSAYQISSKSANLLRGYHIILIFHDGGYGVTNLLPVTGLMTASFEKAKIYLHTEFRWDISIHGWVITSSVWENKRPSYWNYTSGLKSDHIHHLGMLPFIFPPSFVDMWPFLPQLLAFI